MNPDKIREMLREEAQATAARLQHQYAHVALPTLQELLLEQGVIEIRKANGEDTMLAEAAMLSAWGNVARQQHAALRLEARNVAFRVLVAAIRVLGSV